MLAFFAVASCAHTDTMLTGSASVQAAARLHLGFVDLHGGLGRRFGSIGLAISGLDAHVSARIAGPGVLDVRGLEIERAAQAAASLLRWLDVPHGVEISISRVAPQHAGFGSGTQLALAVAAAVSAASGRACSARELAAVVGRGARSGIGVAAFDTGGLLVDGGRGDRDVVAPVISRLDFPARWRAVLIFDDTYRGLHGAAERQAFATAPPMPEAEAALLARCCLIGLLPAVAEQDFDGFARSLAEIQARNGAYFAPYQGGAPFTSGRVATALARIRDACGLVGVGQSSWGPTGFVFTPDAASAESVLRFVDTNLDLDKSLRYQIVSGCNHGALIRTPAA